MVFWFSRCFGVSPHQVFSCPGSLSSGSLPPFYSSLLVAWRSCNGSFYSSSLGVGSGIDFRPVFAFSTKSVYLYLLSERSPVAHCVDKFLPLFGPLYWPSAWRQLFFFDLDRPVIDLSWKVAHDVLYMAERLSSFGYDLPTACFYGSPMESLQHLFYDCPLDTSVFAWVQSLMLSASPLASPILPCHVLFGFSEDELSCVPRIFVYLINVCKFIIWVARNDFRFRDVHPSAVDVIESAKSRFSSAFVFSSFSVSLSPSFLRSSVGCTWYHCLLCWCPSHYSSFESPFGTWHYIGEPFP